jgi:hypothetical protein
MRRALTSFLVVAIVTIASIGSVQARKGDVSREVEADTGGNCHFDTTMHQVVDKDGKPCPSKTENNGATKPANK